MKPKLSFLSILLAGLLALGLLAGSSMHASAARHVLKIPHLPNLLASAGRSSG